MGKSDAMVTKATIDRIEAMLDGKDGGLTAIRELHQREDLLYEAVERWIERAIPRFAAYCNGISRAEMQALTIEVLRASAGVYHGMRLAYWGAQDTFKATGSSDD